MHGFDGLTPVEETLETLDTLVRSGKVRYIACSNFSGWHLMKSLATSEKYGWARYVAHQVYYSLLGREYEWELLPLGVDQKVGALVWSPLGWGRLTEDCPTMAALLATKDRIREATRTYLDSLTEGQLNTTLATRPMDWGGELRSPAFILLHVITHAFHHKGQVVAMLRILGYSAPDTDLQPV